jgi:hypothetical protein
MARLMPLSTILLLACLTVLKWLCVAAGVLLMALVGRGHFDPGVQLPLDRGLIGGGIFFLTALAIHLIRKAIARRSGLNRSDKLDA